LIWWVYINLTNRWRKELHQIQKRKHDIQDIPSP
jgi:hypothetical protein